MSICILYPDCSKPSSKKGYCESHYQRLRRYGDPRAGTMPNGVKGIAECSIKYCDKLVFSCYLCRSHYNVRQAYGEDGLKIAERNAAGDSCDACGQRVEPMHIDHCHLTGIVRGLLCANCNVALGMVGDNPARLIRLIEYLNGGFPIRVSHEITDF